MSNVLPLDEFKDDEVPSFVFAYVKGPGYIIVIETCRRLGFVSKASESVFVGGLISRENLHGHGAIQKRISSAKNSAHADLKGARHSATTATSPNMIPAVASALPVEMTYSGLNFDILTGAGALGLLVWSRLGEIPRWALWGWNTVGLGLLITIVTLAILSFPEPFALFTPPNKIVATFPWVLLPCLLVEVALFGHLIVLRALIGSFPLARA